MKKFLAIAAIFAATALAQEKVPETLPMKTATIQDVLTYLSQKPYAEVAQLIAAIQQEAGTEIQKLNAQEAEKAKAKAKEKK